MFTSDFSGVNNIKPFHGLVVQLCNVGGIILQVSGMTCEGCARKLQRALQTDGRTQRADVDFASGKVTVYGATLSQRELCDVIKDAGFAAEL